MSATTATASPIASILDTLHRSYGPQAFGLVVLVVVWVGLVRPEMRALSEEREAAAAQMRDAAAAWDDAARSLSATTIRLESIARSMHREPSEHPATDR